MEQTWLLWSLESQAPEAKGDNRIKDRKHYPHDALHTVKSIHSQNSTSLSALWDSLGNRKHYPCLGDSLDMVRTLILWPHGLV